LGSFTPVEIPVIGQTVSHYKILSKLGEGGMGVVYKAEDLTLTRIVALKFLPLGLQSHEPERARFLQEARAAAILNHPSICTIHEIADVEGQPFIVMEYVDGVTLRDQIAGGRLPFGSAVAYAIHIGEALEEAHVKGIVHRDIKTENIMVTKSQVKVMDFGLAKLKGSLKLTQTSSTVGTLAYMAPELIEGKETDARSDIFSFGVVLYEMLTGRLPFRGEHEAALMYSIVNEEPESLQASLPDAPSELLHIVNRALEKDPDERYQTVHDMVIDLRRLKKETTRVVRLPPHHEDTVAVREQSTRRQSKRRLAMILGITLGGIGGGIAVLLLSRGPELNPEMTFRVLQLPFRNVSYAGMSQDGNWIAFPAADEHAKFDVYMMNIAQGQPRRITTDSSYTIHGVSLSPDGSTILYSRRRSSPLDPLEIVSVSSLGGTGKVVADSAYNMSWMSDGKRFGYLREEDVGSSRRIHQWWSCRPDGSDRRLEITDTIARRSGIRVSFHYSADGESIAWTKNFPEGYSEIMIRDLTSGTDRQLTRDRKFVDDPLWSRTGHIFFSSNRGGNVNLWMIPEGGGAPVQVTRGGGPDSPLGITPDGTRLMYSEVQDIGQVRIASLKDGSSRQLTVDEWQRGLAVISPSGRYVAFPAQEVDAVSTEKNIYVIDRDGTDLRKLTDDESDKFYPAWSPDEKWITYSARPGNEPDDSLRVYLIRADSPGRPRAIGKGIYSPWFSEKEFVLWSPSGTLMASIDLPECERFSGDSIFAIPVLEGQYVAALDWHGGRRGWLITTSVVYGASGLAGARRLTRGISFGRFPPGTRDFYYVPPGSGEIHRIALPDGRDVAVKKIPGVRVFFSVSTKTEEIAYTEIYRKMRFVLVENVFN
jgi:serine/threonine protein kinase